VDVAAGREKFVRWSEGQSVVQIDDFEWALRG
jgi:hypothetical protein